MMTLGRLTLRLPLDSTPTQRGAWQRRVVSALTYADLTPRSLPPRAILIVRRLNDPLPGALLNGESWLAGQRWGNEAREAVERLWRGAARPAHDPVAAGAAAVWFADVAEWLACLSLDVYYGVAHLRWWWQTRLNAPARRAAAHPLSALWQAEAQWLPAALAYLHERGSVPVTVLISKLPPIERRAVQQAVLHVHNLPPEIIEKIRAPETWRTWIPRADKLGAAPPDTQAAAAILLAVHYAPAALRRAAFETPPANETVRTDQTASAIPSAPDLPHEEVAPALLESEMPPARVPPPAIESPHVKPVDTASAGEPETQPSIPLEGSAIAESQSTKAIESADFIAPALEAAATVPPVTAPVRLDVPAPPRLTDQPEGVVTALGGVWFLINLLLALDPLDGDFSAWLKLDVLARHLLHDAPDSDPLWAALAELAGQERDDAALNQARVWLSETWPQIDSWLLERLGGPEHLALVKSARMFLTRTHIDVVFGINDIDVPLRLAGLDRDPGWVPPLARVILFHFE